MPKEYIDREVALRAITYNPLAKPEPNDIIALTLLTAQKRIKEIPAADVVPVVRCKDCKHYSCLGSCLLHSEIADEYSIGFDFRMDDNDFCSYGERKQK